MNIHELLQGSPEWLAYRRSMRNASDAAAMMGASPYKTRSQLLHECWLGMQPEISEYQQTVVLDPGHAFERLALPVAEDIVGEQLFPVVGSLEGTNLSASFDGLTFSESLHFEHKRLSNVLRECMPISGENENVSLPEYHLIQVNQQFMIAEKSEACLFMGSEWSDDGVMIDEHHCWVYPDEALQGRIEAGWRQFDADLAVYKPAKAEPAKLVGASMNSLPALRVLVKGEVTDTNVDEWATMARAVLGSINRTLNTDQDFADAKEAVKWCEKQEANLKAAKEHALSQTESIDKLFKTVDAIMAETAAIRIEQDKLVKRREGERKTELVGESVAAFHAFVAELNDGLAPYRLPTIAADFPAQIKGKRSFASMQDALGVELARVKIDAMSIANTMRANLKAINEKSDHGFLFNDAASIIQKDAETVALIIRTRIADHVAAKAAEEEATRARIAAEEKEKAEAAARAQAAEILRQEREAQAARDREEAARVEAREAADRQEREDQERERRSQDDAARTEREKAEADLHKLGQTGAPVASAVAESITSSSLETFENQPAYVHEVRRTHPESACSESAEPEHAWVNLGKMAEAFGFRVDAEFVTETLEEPWTRTEKSAKFWTPTAFERIKRKLAAHVLKAGVIPF